MEDSRVTELTRNQAISLNKKYGNVGVALQANLYRTSKDLEVIIQEGVSVRLVKGAYAEHSSVSMQNRNEISDNYIKLANLMLGKNILKNVPLEVKNPDNMKAIGNTIIGVKENVTIR